MTENRENRYEVNNVVEVIDLLKNILDTTEDLSLSQLSKMMNFTKNKTFRLLATLEHHGIVEKKLENKYSVGFALFESARKIMSKRTMPNRIRQYLKEVADLVNESTYYAHMGTENMLLVDFADCSRSTKVASLVGRSIKLPSIYTHDVQTNQFDVIGDIIVDYGTFDSEVTAVIAPINLFMSTKRVALVVVAPNYRMQIDRIKTEIVPALRTVIKRNSHVKLNESKPTTTSRISKTLQKQRELMA